MLSHDEIREELIRQLDAKRLKAKDVAAHLGVAPARVTELRNRFRLVQQDEMAPLSELLGMGAAAKTATILLPVTLPSAAALADMFAGMLEAAKRPDLVDELAGTLARHLPAALERVRERPSLELSDDGRSHHEEPPPPAKGRRGSQPRLNN